MRLSSTRSYWLLRNTVKQLLPRRFSDHGPVEDDPELHDAEHVVLDWPEGVRKPFVGLVRDLDSYPYWTKFRRFLRSNDIPFEIYDIHRSTWLLEAQRFDMVVWRPMNFPYELEECRRKLHILETELDMLCYPSLDEVLLYEDKITQYELLQHHGLPVVETFISNSEAEVVEYLATCDFPKVWKITAGSGSIGVELIRTRRSAYRRARRVFDFTGRRTYWPDVNQKNYVYLQRFVRDAGPDIRIIVVGSMVFGFYRDVPEGDFRASGMNTRRYGALPDQALHLARRVAQVLGLPFVAVDMLADAAGESFQIIETSPIMGIFWLAQLCVDGVPGAYVFDGPGDEYRFVPMRVWTQELALKQVLETRWIPRETTRC